MYTPEEEPIVAKLAGSGPLVAETNQVSAVYPQVGVYLVFNAYDKVPVVLKV